MSDAARRITGRHLMIDGPGAVRDVPTSDAQRVITRAKRALHALGWGGEPNWRHHRAGTTIGVRSWGDVTDVAADLLDWAASDDPDDELDALVRRDERLREPAFRALVQAFPGKVFEGEDMVTVGMGVHARSFRWRDLPSPAEVAPVRGIPIAMITGTNGKTTTTRLTAHLVEAAGLCAGRTSSNGVVIGEEILEQGDWTGTEAARRVLRDPRVQVAVLETARGGLLRRGLVIDGADVAVVTNVTQEHLGEWGIDDLEMMARAKLGVAEGLRRGGTLVVPAESAPIAAVLPRLLQARPDIAVRTFSSRPPPPGRFVHGWADATHLRVGGGAIPLEEIPLTFGGTARHNVENALCATLAALALGVPAGAISRGLRTLSPSVRDNPGRMNTWRLPNGALAIIDFAHNPDGLKRIAETVRRWPRGRRTLLLGQAGDRPDEDLRALAIAGLLLAPQRIVLKDVTRRLYGRPPGQVPAIMRAALLAHGVPESMLISTPDEETGVRAALHGAGPDHVIVLLIHETLAAAAGILGQLGAVEVD